MAGQFREILGVEVVLEPVEAAALRELASNPETFPQLSFGGWTQDYPDPQSWLSVYWLCASAWAERPGYCNPDFDRLVQQADRELDPQRRIDLYEEANQLLLDDLPVVFLGSSAKNVLVRPAVTGYAVNAIEAEWPGLWTSPLTIDIAA
jgi:ABC-type oligopeptide transport system substrate-binding subunit